MKHQRSERACFGPNTLAYTSKISKLADGLEGVLGGLQCIISADQFRNHISKILPCPGEGRAPRKRLREGDYNGIAELLNLRGKRDWSFLPRTFAVLYPIGLERFMDDFVAANYSDIYLPYTEENLPDALTGEARQLFLNYQENVLISNGAKIESGLYPHIHLSRSAAELFFPIGLLGVGGFGEVHHVVGKASLKHFAWKIISRRHFDTQKERQYLQTFQNELTALQSLRHRYVVRLVGSYSDADHVGLLMRPVADQDLSKFLSEPMSKHNHGERCLRLRGFFGCLAIAVDYFHNNDKKKVQHKDIKPQNILVKGSKIYITDFGTARLRDVDLGDVTEPTASTMVALSWKYAAPEVARGSTRTYASDIWSLGCVFVEMLTVLAGKSLSELSSFMQQRQPRSDAEPGRFRYFDNHTAITSWLQILKETLPKSDGPQDAQMIEVVKTMLYLERASRITARHLVRRIFQLDGMYHGHCCKHEATSFTNAMGGLARYDSWRSENSAIQEIDSSDSSETETDRASSDDESPLDGLDRRNIDSGYFPPQVEDIETTTLVVANQRPKVEGALMEDVTVLVGEKDRDLAASSTVSLTCKTSTPTERKFPINATSQKEAERSTDSCLRLVVPEPAFSQADVGGLPCPWPNCKPPKGLAFQTFDGIDYLRQHLRGRHLVHDLGKTYLVKHEGQQSAIMGLTPTSGAFELRSNTLRAVSENARFAELPRDRRPVPLQKEPSTRQIVQAKYSVCAELPAAPGEATLGQIQACKKLDIPPSTYVPSYILATKNRFSQLEVLSNRSRKPLFVCGTLMFPNVLLAMSERFASPDGTYSAKQNRRLFTTPDDWSGLDKSLQAVAERMAPAVLPRHERFQLPRFSIAYVRPSSEPGACVAGFLVFGLSSDALASLDTLFEEGGPRHFFSDRVSKTREWQTTRLTRGQVNVDINVIGGDVLQVAAETYLPNTIEIDFPKHAKPWDMDRFLRGRSFGQLAGYGRYLTEETAIAKILGTRLLLPGDGIVSQVLKNNLEGIDRMLEDGYDIDAPSIKYGTALQAAAYSGNGDMVNALLERNADIDAKGGEYGSALVAAVVEGHTEVVKLLLKNNAKLFLSGGKYVSALYQAVDFERFEVASMLLEKGAWLTSDYGELLDLAKERDNEELYGKLLEYDVRDCHKKRAKRLRSSKNPAGSEYDNESPKRESKQAVESTSSAGVVCLFEAWKLHNQPGKWTGKKLVTMLRAGIEHGLDPGIMEKIRPFVHSFPAIQQFFVDAMGPTLGRRFMPERHTDPQSNDGQVANKLDWAEMQNTFMDVMRLEASRSR